MRKLILASASPWRKKILTASGISFTVEVSGYDEDMSLSLSPGELAQHLALGKATSVAGRHNDEVVLGADTFVVFENKLLGKPHTKERAIEMLAMLRGKTHELLTGFAIVDSKTGKSTTKAVNTRVTMRQLTDAEIEAYVETGEPLDAAGAYVIQGGGAKLMEKIDGDIDNIAGLPIQDVLHELAKFGVKV